MKKRQGVSKRGWVTGTIIFLALIACIIQIAVMIFDYVEERTQNRGWIAFIMLIVIVALAAVCTAIDVVRRKRMVERPTEEILLATERIAEGDFSTRLEARHPYGKYDQYDLIMENLNVMAAELEKTEVLKTDFISNVSHELKTPLTAIKSYAGLLQSADLDKETRERYAKAVVTATDRLNALITNILQLNKLENQEIKPELERFDLTQELGECVLQFEEYIEKKNLELVCDFEDKVEVFSSKAYLNLVWNNLLSNAVKFTDEGGRVALKLRKEDGKAVVCVQDSGCGISPEVGARLFEKFYQGDTSHAQEGNGLGLALVKRVVDILGGEISVESELGKGTTFKVVLKEI